MLEFKFKRLSWEKDNEINEFKCHIYCIKFQKGTISTEQVSQGLPSNVQERGQPTRERTKNTSDPEKQDVEKEEIDVMDEYTPTQ